MKSADDIVNSSIFEYNLCIISETCVYNIRQYFSNIEMSNTVK